MDLRLGLYGLAATHHLDASATTRLEAHAGLGAAPASLARRTALGMAVLAAALIGLGLVFWVAAHWDTLGRTGRFALLQVVLLVMAVGAVARPEARVPLSLLVLLSTGGLLAYFGQTYQTGADAWQLFALWAVLMLPLCWGLRSDVLWTPWALVSMTAVSLWVQTHTGHTWRALPDDVAAHMAGWALGLLVALVLSPPLRRATGASMWALRLSLTLLVVMVSASALGALFQREVAGQYGLGLVLLAALAVWLSLRSNFDIFGLSAAALGLNTLLFGGLVRLLFDRSADGDMVGRLLLLGLMAAALLAGTVSLILRLSRHHTGSVGSAGPVQEAA